VIPLVVEAVSRDFGGLRAVRDVSLELRPGSRHVILGPNGAGKTTLFNIIGGQDRPTRGRVLLFGRDATAMRPYQRTVLGLGRTFQITSIFSELTVGENLLLAAQALDRVRFFMHRPAESYPHIVEHTERLLEEWDLSRLATLPCRVLSYGDQRRVELAMAMTGRPRLLLLDEPTAGLSLPDTRKVTALIRALDPAITLLLIEHNMDVAFEIADRVTVMHDGAVLADGTPTEVRRDPRVLGIYLGEEAAAQVIAAPRRVAPAAALVSGTGRAGLGATVLEVEDLDTYHGDSHVLQGVSLSVRQGEVAAVLGRNGAGKTTLIRSIIGFTTPRRGAVTFRGTNVARLPASRIARMGIGIVPQGRRIFKALTVRENLEIAVHRRMVPGTRRSWTVDTALALFPILRQRLRHRGGQLSGGEQQMLSTARGLVSNPDFLLMDEPTEGLAPLLVQEMKRLVRALKASGHSILLVEQNLAFALDVSDYVYVLAEGRVVHGCTPEELRSDHETMARYLGV
jgi:ABC-type branched-subunit amino acid transport system ATPase component